MLTGTAAVAFRDQVLAATREGPATTTVIAARVRTVCCACPVCQGRRRPAVSDDVYPFLLSLQSVGLVVGVVARGIVTWEPTRA